jgi:Ca-activated chloride channel family protein
MPDLSQMSNFHFMRPLWLLMLIPVVLVLVLLLRQQGITKRWQKIIAPHLLKHLIVGTEQRALIQPVHLFFTVCVIAIFALSGPAWEREASPFTEDEASLVIALDLSISMNAIDVKPTRLMRAQQKVQDLLAHRIGARTGLIAYAGSAHMVLPLTDDPHILETYLTSLSSDVMPAMGKDPSKALVLARDMLEKERAPGTILFVTDGISKDHLPAFVEHNQKSTYEVVVLGVGTSKGGPVLLKKNDFMKDSSGKRVFSRLNREGLDMLSSEAGAYVTTVTVDDRDVRWVNGRIESHLT